ncbi:putative bifunctional diguanylate cyclase/phosphodiesterase [Micromonospora polyrhachis]|uniref:Diguanylate cyclase (GGDEF)-like protein n=1 Tax=Micromonospora polyrhachis TaxID=1282883 RepID=A0A7W7SNU3_9ACTN|nr:diguanylate cyclase (GGDEF)-like protein [Micromonospora polyrhachis]
MPFFSFVWTVVALAALLCIAPLLRLPEQIPDLPVAFWTMAALALVSDARPFTPPGHRQSPAVFPSVCFAFAILLAWGLGPAVAVQAGAVVVSSWRMRHAPWRMIFNIAQYAVGLAAASAITGRTTDIAFRTVVHPRWTDVLLVVGAATVWFVITYGCVSIALGLRFGGAWWPHFRQPLAFELLSTGSLLLLSPVLVAAAEASAALIPLVVVPLFAVYRMSRLSSEQERLARLDPLTGLVNRKALRTEVAEQLRVHTEQAAKGGPDAQLALLLLDLDRFKHVNDALGHAVGDRLLVQVAHRLTATVRSQDVVARLGGDEFAILLTRLRNTEEARQLAEQVEAVLAEPVALDGLPLDVGGSIGIALYPEHGEDFATLMRHADVAMYDAKHQGDPIAVYAPESDHNSPERLSLLADLRRVLDNRPALAEGSNGRPEALPVATAPAGTKDEATSPPSDRVPAAPVDVTEPGSVFDTPSEAAIVPSSVASILGTANRPTTDPAEATGAARYNGALPGSGGGPLPEVTGAPLADTTGPMVDVTGPVVGGDGAAADSPVGGATVGDGALGGGDVGEITMYYQPQIAIDTGEVVGVEALLRWRHPRRGMVDPEELIRVAEQSAVMRLLTRRVVDDVVEQLAQWSAIGLQLRAALNVSVRDLHTGEIADQITERLARFQVSPAQLQLEITEGALMADPRRVLATISRLDRIGVAIALDDFGTGYSSMQHLRRLPLAEVKVDRSFVLGMAADADDAAIVRSVIELARALGLRVVAEGVEDEATWRLLHAAGCHVAQGWFFARPMPAAELVTWLGRYRPLKPTPIQELPTRHRTRN